MFFNIFPNSNSAPNTIKARGVAIFEISDNVLYIGFGIFIFKIINIIPNKVAIIKGFLITCFKSFNLLISLPE